MNEAVICTNLREAQAGQLVKIGSTGSGVTGVKAIKKVWRDGRIEMDGFKEVYRVDVGGRDASRQGESGRYRTSRSMIWAFAEGETAESVLAEVEARRKAVQDKAEAEAAEAEAKTQEVIAKAGITFSDSRDIPGARIARWTDRRGEARMTLFFGKSEPWWDDRTYYSVQVADYKDGSFGASTANSMESFEDAVSRWVAAWW